MWLLWGSALNVCVSGTGALSFGGNALGHECRPATDQFNEQGELDEAIRVSKLPLSWSVTLETGRDAESSLSNYRALVGQFRRPQKLATIIGVHPEIVGLSAFLPETHFYAAYDAAKSYLLASAEKEYVLSVDFIGARHPTSDAAVPTVLEFYRNGHPYILENPPALAFKYGQGAVA